MTTIPLATDVRHGLGRLHHDIDESRRLLRAGWLATGACAAAGVVTAVTSAAVWLDLLAPLAWNASRAAVTAMVLLAGLWAILTGVLRPLLRRLSDRGVARRVERVVGDRHDRLVSCLDFAARRDDRAAGLSADRVLGSPFFQKLLREAVGLLAAFAPARLVDRASLGRSALGLVAAVLFASALLGAYGSRFGTSLQRLAFPWADIAPDTGVAFRVAPGDAVVARGDTLAFEVGMAKGRVDDCRLVVSFDDGGALVRRLSAGDDDAFRFALADVRQPFTYRVEGGGTWTARHQVRVVDRPVISALQTSVRSPGYMQAVGERFGQVDVAAVGGPEGGIGRVAVTAGGNVGRGWLAFLEPGGAAEGPAGPDRIWIADSVPDKGRPGKNAWRWRNDLAGAKGRQGVGVGGERNGHKLEQIEPGFAVGADEVVFVDVYLNPTNPPREIMLSALTKGWDHRAFWGEDQINQGERGRGTRRLAGPLPAFGQWVRLEIPAELVDLDDRVVRGLEFLHDGGEMWWGPTGVRPARKPARKAWQEVGRVALAPASSAEAADWRQAGLPSEGAVWQAEFPLVKSGHYRVEMVNELGLANEPMAPAAITVTPDLPPVVLVDRPPQDLILSAPAVVPLHVIANDDFGLAGLLLVTRPADADDFAEQCRQRVDGAAQRSVWEPTLDLTVYGGKAKGDVRCRIDATDLKGQKGSSREFKIRFANDDRAADRQLARSLDQLNRLKDEVNQLAGKERELKDRLDKLADKPAAPAAKAPAAAKQDQAKSGKPDKTPPKPVDPPPTLDPSSKKYAEAKARLNEVGDRQKQLADRLRDLANQVHVEADRIAKNPVAATESAEQLKTTARLAAGRTAEQMSELGSDERRQAKNESKPGREDAAKDAEKSDELTKELERMAERIAGMQQAMMPKNRNLAEAGQSSKAEAKRQQDEIVLDELTALSTFAGEMAAKLEQLDQLDAAKPPAVAADEPLPARQDPKAKPIDPAAERALKERAAKQLAAEKKAAEQRRAADAALAKAKTLLGTAAPTELNPAEGPPMIKPALGDAPPAATEPASIAKTAPAPPQPKDAAKPRAPSDQQAPATAASKPKQAGSESSTVQQQTASTKSKAELPKETPKADAAKDLATTAPLGKSPGSTDRPATPKPSSAPGGDAKLAQHAGPAPGDSKAPSGGSRTGDAPGATLAKSAGRPGAPAVETKDGGDPAAAKADVAAKPAAAKSPTSGGASAPDAAAPSSPPIAADSRPAAATPLAQASQSLRSDVKTLAGLSGALGSVLKDVTPKGAAERSRLLDSTVMRQALDMAGRMRLLREEQRKPGGRQGGQDGPIDPNGTLSSMPGSDPGQSGPRDGKLDFSRMAELDPNLKAMLMKLPAAVRLELLQGAREAGPDAYDPVIRDYFLRLSRLKE